MPTNTKALQVAEPVAQIAGKNGFINGGMDIWQRGTSIAMTTTNYGPDRVGLYRSGGGATISKQSSGLVNIPNCARVQRDSGNSSTGIVYIGQPMDVASSAPFIGQTVTFSFYARAGANYSPSGSALVAKVYTGTNTTDYDGFHGSYTGVATPISSTVTLTSSWQRFTVSGFIPSTAVQLLPQFEMVVTGTAGANDYYEVTGVQLELGSTATPFSRAGGDIQGELAKCVRYYERRYGKSNGTPFGVGQCYSTTAAVLSLPFFPKRVTPTLGTGGTVSITNSTFGGVTVTLSVGYSSLDCMSVTATGGSGLTAGNATTLSGLDANSYVEFSAEL